MQKNHTQITDNSRGIILMITAVLILPFSDAIAKWLTSSYTVIQISFIRFSIQTLIILLMIYFFKGRIKRFKLVYLYSGFFITSTIVLLFWGLKYLPMANNIALFFIEPLILSLLSIIFLKERLEKNHIIAIIIGLIGTLIIIRPNWSAYGIAALLPIGSAFFYALYLISIRHFSSGIDAKSLQFYVGIFASLLLGIVLLISVEFGFDSFGFNQLNLTEHWWLFILLGIITTIVQLLVSQAFSYSKASSLASFQYLEIISASFLGWIIFKNIPDVLTILGSIIVIFSGVYLIRHERKNSK